MEHSAGDEPEFAIKLWNGAVYIVGHGKDPVHQSEPTRTCFHLNMTMPANVDHLTAKNIAIVAMFARNHIIIDDPSAQIIHGNAFLRTEAMFWSEIDLAQSGSKAIELGSRARSGVVRKDRFPSRVNYVGFDIKAGVNVDVVGDAHELSKHFEADTFDYALSISVWEHLAMPWKVTIGLNKVMKTGGLALICSHQTWPAHEQPWDFFRFSDDSWNALFCEESGFEVVSTGMGFPAITACATMVPYLQDQMLEWNYGYLASAALVRKVAATKLIWSAETKEVVQGGYPY